jgi:hypothetical protein
MHITAGLAVWIFRPRTRRLDAAGGAAAAVAMNNEREACLRNGCRMAAAWEKESQGKSRTKGIPGVNWKKM